MKNTNLFNIITFLALVPVSGLAISSTAQTILTQLPLPPQSVATALATNTEHNGLSVNVASFHSKLSIDRVISFYRILWSTGSTATTVPAYLEYTIGKWRTIATRQHDYSVVLQVSTTITSTTHGYLSVIPLEPLSGIDQSATNSGNNQHFGDGAFTGASELSRTQTVDGSVHSDLRVFSSTMSVSSALNSFTERLRRRNWQPVWQSRQRRQAVLMMEQDNKAIEVMLVESDSALGAGQTLVIANEVTRR